MEIKDSGERREFSTGSVRDLSEGKGRFDLMPMDVLATLSGDSVIAYISAFMENGEVQNLQDAYYNFVYDEFTSEAAAWLALAKHFEKGMKKYGPDNWRKGIPASSYCDSALRHYCKHNAGYDDEPHAVACLWNIVCCLWTIKHKPELNCYKK